MAQFADKLKHEFMKRSDSDRRALVILFAFLLGMALYKVTVFSFDFRQQALDDFQESRSFLWSMNRKAEVIKSVPSASAELHAQSLLSVISTSAKQQDFVFQRVQPEGDNILKVWMEKVYFNNLLSWLYYLDNTAGVSVEQISVEQVSEGYVNVRLTLVR